MADLCTIHLVEDGHIRRVAVAHIASERLASIEQRQQQHPIDPDEEAGVARVIRTGRSELHSSVSDELLAEGAPDEQRLTADRALGLSSVLLVPMRRPHRRHRRHRAGPRRERTALRRG